MRPLMPLGTHRNAIVDYTTHALHTTHRSLTLEERHAINLNNTPMSRSVKLLHAVKIISIAQQPYHLMRSLHLDTYLSALAPGIDTLEITSTKARQHHMLIAQPTRHIINTQHYHTKPPPLHASLTSRVILCNSPFLSYATSRDTTSTCSLCAPLHL